MIVFVLVLALCDSRHLLYIEHALDCSIARAEPHKLHARSEVSQRWQTACLSSGGAFQPVHRKGRADRN